jgi:hypothetical protein
MSTEAKGVAAVTPNNRYNLMGVIYHALQGGQRYGKYAEDAEREGDREAARFSATSNSVPWQRSQGEVPYRSRNIRRGSCHPGSSSRFRPVG